MQAGVSVSELTLRGYIPENVFDWDSRSKSFFFLCYENLLILYSLSLSFI